MVSQVAPISSPWLVPQGTLSTAARSHLVQIRLDLSFLQPIAKAMDFSPALRPVASGRRQLPENWCNLRNGFS